MVFNSACAITGKVLEYTKNKTMKKPIVPIYIPMSTKVGENIDQLDGKKSLCRDVTIITKRSNHIPIFTKIDKIKVAIKLFLIELICSVICG